MRVTVDQKRETMLAGQLKIGDIAILHSPYYEGEVVLKSYSGLVSLSNPRNTWSSGYEDIPAKKMAKGTRITLEVE